LSRMRLRRAAFEKFSNGHSSGRDTFRGVLIA
jgi:hypothetical protein